MVVTCQNSLGQTGPKISHYPISRPRCWEVFLHQLVARQIMKSSKERWSSSKLSFFLSHSSVRNIYKGRVLQRESLWFFRTLWQTTICGKVDRSGTGMIWGGHGPQSIPFCHTELCLPAERVGADRNHEGRGSNTPWATPLCTWPPSPSATLAAPSPPLQGVPRGGNKQQHGAQLK